MLSRVEAIVLFPHHPGCTACMYRLHIKLDVGPGVAGVRALP